MGWLLGLLDCLTRQGMWNTRGLHRKGLTEREEKERVLSSERAHKQVLTVKKTRHLILKSSTGTLVTVATGISTSPDGGFHRASMCSQAKPAHVLHKMLREIMVQKARRHQGGTPIPHRAGDPSAWISLKI